MRAPSLVLAVACGVSCIYTGAASDKLQPDGQGPLAILYPATADTLSPPRWDNIEAPDDVLRVIGGENIFEPDADPEFLWGRVVPPGGYPRSVLGSGLLGWFHHEHPNRSLSQQYAGSGALNFEHVISLLPEDTAAMRQEYTPRNERCFFEKISEDSFKLSWPAGAWPIEAGALYRLLPGGAIEITFQVHIIEPIETPQLRFMFASYMQGAYLDSRPDHRPHSLYFGPAPELQLGKPGQITETAKGYVIAGKNSPVAPLLPGTYDLNLRRWSAEHLSEPLWLGFLDGDHDARGLTDNPYALGFAFEQENVELLAWFWAFPQTLEYPAWDWQWVVYAPVAGRSYTYRALISYEAAQTDHDGNPDLVAAWEAVSNKRAAWVAALSPLPDDNPPVIRFLSDIVPPAGGTPAKWRERSSIQHLQDAPFDPASVVEYVVDNEEGVYLTAGRRVPPKDGASPLDIISTVDATQPGTYSVAVEARDAAGNAASREIPVTVIATPDVIAPTIELVGEASATVARNTPFLDPGVLAQDNRQPAPRVEQRITSPSGRPSQAINTHTLGKWAIQYWCVDGAGNRSVTVTRSIQVRDSMLRDRFLQLLLQWLTQRWGNAMA